MSTTAVASSPVRREAAASAKPASTLLPIRALLSAVAVSLFVSVLLSIGILVGLDGARYYATPLAVRGYHPAHALLRPSGPVGQTLGLVGAVMMLVPFGYMLRKRLFKPRGGGNLKVWLEVHIFCGIVGPVLITYHTAFKFNGLVSVAYWSMVAVALSGFVGRYLYVRIPRTIRGVEVSEADLGDRAADLQERLQWVVSPAIMARLEAFEQGVVLASGAPSALLASFVEGRRLRRHLTSLRLELLQAGVSEHAVTEVIALFGDRAQLLRRLRHLHRTKRLFDLWHVFHLPLVYIMFSIVALHVAVVLYLGYVPFRW